MTADRARARVFGEVAEEYDRIRPGYPAALVDDVLAYAALDGAPALEVGAGTGKATVAFAERGVAITALEPDEAMARVLARRVRGRPNVTVTISSFEEYEPVRPFGLLFSGQAWHWMDPAVRWQRAAAALAPGGAVALFWNGDYPADLAAQEVLLAVHQEHAPQIVPELELPAGDRRVESLPGTELVAGAEFSELSERVYPSERALSIEDYLACLSTRSAYRILDDTVRATVFAELRQRLGERITFRVETALYLARRLPR